MLSAECQRRGGTEHNGLIGVILNSRYCSASDRGEESMLLESCLSVQPPQNITNTGAYT